MPSIFSAPCKTSLNITFNEPAVDVQDINRHISGSSWPQGSVRRWTRLVMKEALPRVCTAPPDPSRTRSPGRCSSPRTSPCGSGRSSGPARSARRSSSPRGNSWCRSRCGQTQEPAPSRRERKSRMWLMMITRVLFCVEKVVKTWGRNIFKYLNYSLFFGQISTHPIAEWIIMAGTIFMMAQQNRKLTFYSYF